MEQLFDQSVLTHDLHIAQNQVKSVFPCFSFHQKLLHESVICGVI